jgi:4-hydroxy-tetrahydrodipicolinate synthase
MIMNDLPFRGAATAVVTPFKNGEIDFSAFRRLIEMQTSAGITTLVICGTTGESPTLTEKEKLSLFAAAIEYSCGKAKIIAGCGSPSTAFTCSLARQAEQLGVDALLTVTPYYNKCTAEGLYLHYRTIADSVSLPIIAYNVPSRTGVNLTQKQLSELSENPLICGIKEALDSIDRFVDIAAMGGSLPLYSGSDYATYTALSLGGAGVISVVSNIYPERMLNISRSYFSGDSSAALSAQLELSGFIKAMFTETNPSPIKYAMSLIGLCEADVRLPLYPPEEKTCELIRAEMRKLIL